MLEDVAFGPLNLDFSVTAFTVWQDFMPGAGGGSPPLYATVEFNVTNNGNLLNQILGEVMTPNPISLQEDALAAEALKIFNERSIDDLIVVNAKHEPIGLVDSQDLPKLKLM